MEIDEMKNVAQNVVRLNFIYSRAIRFLIRLASFIIAAGIVGLIIFRIGWVTDVDKHEYAFAFNRFTGEIELIDRTGYIVRTPFKYAVHSIDGRPYQLPITASFGDSSSSLQARILNAKLVRFNPAGLPTFVAWHGRHAGDDLKNLKEIMKCYAFDKDNGADCPFIEVISEINPSQAQTPATSVPVSKVP